MGILDIFSKRQMRNERSQKGNRDVYQYTSIPLKFRNQVIHIIRQLPQNEYPFGEHWKPTALEYTHNALCEEYGTLYLYDEALPQAEQMIGFFSVTDDYAQCLDFIEVFFRFVEDIGTRPSRFGILDINVITSAIITLNQRFLENQIGYQYESGCIIKMDSQLMHEEVTKPALNFLSNSIYKNANKEFLSAHEHYRQGRHGECLNDCLRAFESTMKVICTKRKWKYDQKDPAKRLIDILFQNHLIPDFMQAHYAGLRSTLESGVPTVRNNLSAHGEGEKEIKVPESVASYALHITAANIVFLIKADGEMNSQ